METEASRGLDGVPKLNGHVRRIFLLRKAKCMLLLSAVPRRSLLGAALIPEKEWCRIGGTLALSERELQLVRGVFDDLTEVAIADQLGISPHTVHTHCERLHHKLSVATRVQLVLRITEEFLRDCPNVGHTADG